MKTVEFLSRRERSVQDSLPYRRVLTTHAMYTCIFVCSVTLLFVHNLVVSLESVVAAFPRRQLSSVSNGEAVGDR